MDLGIPSSFTARIAGNSVGAQYKVRISSQGIYRITQPVLKSAGFSNQDLIGRRLSVFNRTNEIPVLVSTSGPMQADDYLLFYAEGFNGTHTDQNVYWIGVSEELGKRMDLRNALPFSGVDTITSYCATSRHAPKNKWNPYFRPFDASFDHWYDQTIIMNGQKSISFQLNDVINTGKAHASVKIGSYPGLSVMPGTPYTIRFSANGTYAGNLTYIRNDFAADSLEFNAGLLRSGFSTITLENTSSWAFSLLRKISLSYTRNLKALNNRLAFQGEEGVNNYQLNGFSNSQILILDITDSSNPIWLDNFNVSSYSGKYRAEFGDVLPEETVCYFASDMNGIVDVSSVEKVTFKDHTNPKQHADYIIITQPLFSQESQQLANWRKAQGYKTKVVFLDDLYNEFSYGLQDPAAIRQFLGYAFHHWLRPTPSFAVLIGDAVYDPKNYQGKGLSDILPTHFGQGIDSFTSHDMWFGLVNGADPAIDISIGRIPVTSRTQLSQIINKIKKFENSASSALWRKRITCVADKLDIFAGDFKKRSNEFITYYFAPNSFSSTTAYLDEKSYAEVRNLIPSKFSSGQFIIQYAGHGGSTSWVPGQNNVLNYNSVMALNNSICPIVPIWACNTGMFHGEEESLAEGLLEQNNGAALCISATSEALEAVSAMIGHGFFEAMINQKMYRVGSALQQGFLLGWEWSSSSPELLFYDLFGDPALISNPVNGGTRDSDGDGMDDTWESLHGTEPFIADSQVDLDNDSLINLVEYQQGLNPIAQDTDDDGLQDSWEAVLGLNAGSNDSDGDGMSDQYEITHRLNPNQNDAASDPDGDGLSNLMESQYNLNPNSADSDFDGLSDYAELYVDRTDPLKFDSDSDGIGDGDEKNVYHTNPLDADTNNDGMPDGWVPSYGVEPGQEDTHSDPDADGLTNLEEFHAGCSPGYADTDRDGLLDGAEVKTYHSDPLLEDTDGDGLKDGDEVLRFSTDPTLSDSDGDRLDDGWELLHGLDPTRKDPDDIDGDGVLNVVEIHKGLNATSTDSDNDGLSDDVELYIHKTDPLKADSDGDGLSDREEVITYGTNPLETDSDNDKFPDNQEIEIGTNPVKADTDEDGMIDSWEIKYGLNPNFLGDMYLDTDKDGLSNTMEHSLKTNPLNKDTDGDNLKDGEEIMFTDTDPLKEDTDYDGLNDYAETKTYHTNPHKKDSDQDGMLDGWEATYGLNPLDPNDANGDLDGDKITNLRESELYTDPTKTDSDDDGLSDKYELDNNLLPDLQDRDMDGLTDGSEVLVHGTDPLKIDTDGDGIIDGYEINYYKTNPLKKDTDDDGIPDKIEIQMELDPLKKDAHLDSDSDNLSNLEEYQHNTDPLDSDSDDDGILDGHEISHSLTDPLSADSDQDGLTDFAEIIEHKTNPLKSDHDNDGLPDAWEVEFGTNPLLNDKLSDYDKDGLPNHQEYLLKTDPHKADTDEDGLSDLDEISYGTSPKLSDTDQDGLPDLYEVEHGLNPNLDDAQNDKDLDGLSNKEEYEQNSNPLQRNENTTIFVRLEIHPPKLYLYWPSKANKTYDLFLSTNLVPISSLNLEPIQTNIIATPPENKQIMDIEYPHCFFWVEEK